LYYKITEGSLQTMLRELFGRFLTRISTFSPWAKLLPVIVFLISIIALTPDNTRLRWLQSIGLEATNTPLPTNTPTYVPSPTIIVPVRSIVPTPSFSDEQYVDLVRHETDYFSLWLPQNYNLMDFTISQNIDWIFDSVELSDLDFILNSFTNSEFFRASEIAFFVNTQTVDDNTQTIPEIFAVFDGTNSFPSANSSEQIRQLSAMLWTFPLVLQNGSINTYGVHFQNYGLTRVDGYPTLYLSLTNINLIYNTNLSQSPEESELYYVYLALIPQPDINKIIGIFYFNNYIQTVIGEDDFIRYIKFI